MAEETETTDVETAPAGPPLSPKERRSRTRARKAAKAPAPAVLTPEERHAARVVERKEKAVARRNGRLKAREKAKASGTTATATPAREHVQGRQKSRSGVVVSDRAAKTITVRIDVAHRHRRYQKVVRTSTTLHAHDERDEAHIGDTVLVQEARPLSRTKRWRLIEVLERAR
jgi:small subunit ribosomal protein S17